MLFRAGAPRKMAKVWAGALRFCADRRGIAAIEFAFIAPMLLVMYFVTMEVSQAIEASKKVGRVGSMVADLVTQQDSITKEQLDAIMDISQTTLQPYNRSRPTIIVTAIEISNDAALKATVLWSRKLANGAYGAGAAKKTTTTVPAAMKIGRGVPDPGRKRSRLQADHHLGGERQGNARPRRPPSTTYRWVRPTTRTPA